jgi:hypothetical protein
MPAELSHISLPTKFCKLWSSEKLIFIFAKFKMAACVTNVKEPKVLILLGPMLD